MIGVLKVLAVYERKRGETGNGTLTLAEQHLYGASRLGMTKPNLVLSGTGTGSADPTAPAVHYELTNHLGNVLAVITPDVNNATQPAIESLTDYYPFGMESREGVITPTPSASATRVTRRRTTWRKVSTPPSTVCWTPVWAGG